MTTASDGERRDLFAHLLVPVANEEDARATIEALRGYELVRVTVLHVIEKAGGAPDKASVEQRKQQADDIFDAAEEGLARLDVPAETELRFGTDVAEVIVEAAREADASAIAFTPRGGSRWVKLLTGNVTTELVTESDVPVVVLPDQAEVTRDG